MSEKEVKYKVGIVGIGMVGGALKKYFESKPAYEVSLHLYDKKGLGSMEEVNKADFIYLCLPTPYKPETGCDISILEDTIRELKPDKVLIIKSTIPPGTTDYLQRMYPNQKFIFNPEFLTEETSDQDMCFPDRQIVGVTDKSYTVAKDVLQQLPLAPFERIVPAKVAEFIKYGNNTWFAVKVAKNNEMYDLAMKIGFSEAEWEMFTDGIASDRRIGRTHLKIMHKGKRGYFGKCIPKDSKALIQFAKRLKIRMPVLEATDQYNDQLLDSQGYKKYI